MGEAPANPTAPGASPRELRLDSWKEIAAYLRRDVSTVQRWEKREGMPVHRHVHDKLGSVYAFRTEIDAWSRSRTGISRGIPAEAPAFWGNPLASAEFASIIDFEGVQQAATISRDGKFVAFLSNRDGRTDLWITQIGAAQFYNLTRGAALDLVNPDVRTLSFSSDGTLVLFWARTSSGPAPGCIGIWSVPTLGGRPRPYLDGVSEFDWSETGRLVYHTAATGDPMFVTGPHQPPPGRQIFEGAPGRHAHFPVWSPDEAFIYFVAGIVPNGMDLWRMTPDGKAPERLTLHNSRVGYPVFVNPRTVLYLAACQDGSGPWLHALDTRDRTSHRIGAGIDQYTSLAASGDRRRLIATRSNLNAGLWRAVLSKTAAATSGATRIDLTTGCGHSPRFGPGYLLYVAPKGTSDALWKLATGEGAELWSAPPGAHIIGGPAITADGARIAVAVNDQAGSRLYVMNADGTHARVIADSLDLRGAPVWAPDERSLLVTAADPSGMPRVCSALLDGGSLTPVVSDYSVDPVWAPDGSFILYSGPDIGTTFHVKAVSPKGSPCRLPNLVLTRGARHVAFLPGRSALLVLKGDLDHKDVWLIDLETGVETRVTTFGRDVVVRDFDISRDGRELVIEQIQQHSDIVRIDLPAR